MVKVIRAEYDGLREAAKVFAHHADLSVALTFQIEGLVDQLQDGAWRGVGAEAFYAEMRDLILPAMGRLQDALQFARDSTLTIIEIMQAAEDESAALFRGLRGGEITPPRQDDEERRRRLLHMLKETLRLSGLLNAPLPENLESLTIAELEALLDGNENRERSRITLGKLVLWALDTVQSSALEDAFRDLSAEQRYELLTALTWIMEHLSRGETPDTPLLDNLSEPVRGLVLTTLLNVVQRFRLAQTDERVKTEIEYQHTIDELGGAAFADWIGNLNLFWAIGSRFYSHNSGGGGSGGGGSPSSTYGTAGEIADLNGKTFADVDSLLRSHTRFKGTNETKGGYIHYRFDEGLSPDGRLVTSEIILKPNGEVVRIPKPIIDPTTGQNLTKNFQIDIGSGQLIRPHQVPREQIIR